MAKDLTNGQQKTGLIVDRPVTFSSQIELAKYPQLFSTTNVPHPREYSESFTLKTPQVVDIESGEEKRKIALPEGTRVLETIRAGVYMKPDGTIQGAIVDHDDLIGMLEVVRQDQKSNTIANPLSHFFDLFYAGSLEPMGKRRRRASSYKETFSSLTSDLMNIVFSAKRLYHLPDGSKYETETTYKVLSKKEVFSRETSNAYRDVSRLTFDETYIKATENSKFKIRRLDQIVKLKRSGSKKLYKHLDWMLFNQDKYECNIDDLAKRLEIGRASRQNRVKDFRVFCSELTNALFTHGMIATIQIRKSVDNKTWNIFVKKSPIPETLEVQETPAQPVLTQAPPAPDEQWRRQKEKEEKEEAELDAYYESLSDYEKNVCHQIAEAAVAKISPNLVTDLFRRCQHYTSIRQHKEERGAELLFQKMREKRMVACEPAADDYLPDPAVIFRRLFPRPLLALEYKPLMS